MAYKQISPQSVTEGGTGASTLTGVLTGNGTSAVTANAVTQYGTVIAGASNAVTSVAPSATTGVPLVSQGASSNPAYSTAVVAGGGTGATTLTGVLTGNGTSAVTANAITQYQVLLGGASNAVNEVSGVGTSGQVLTSNGAGMDPSWQDASGGGIGGDTGATDNAVLRADGTGGATLQNSTMIISDAGEMTNSSQPAFLADLGTADNNVTGNGTTYTLGQGNALTEITDQGADFDPGGSGTATFTAPITGTYFLSTKIFGKQSSGGTRGVLTLVTSNRSYSNVGIPNVATSGNVDNFMQLSTLADMDAADTATVTYIITGVGADTADVSSSGTFFNGNLVC